MKVVKATIERYSAKGHGVTDDPVPLEVVGSVKGDTLLLELLKKRKKRHKTNIQELITAGPNRVSAMCPHSGVCGGCKWQQLSYDAQLKEKQGMIEALFPNYEVSPIVGMEEPWHYRGKMEFSFSQDKEGNRFLGLMGVNGRGKVENLSTCLIAAPWVSNLLGRIKAWWEKTSLRAYHHYSDEGSLRTLTVRSSEVTGAKMVFLTVSGRSQYALSKKDLDSFIEAAKVDEKTSIYIVIQRCAKGFETEFFEMHLSGPEYMEEELLGHTFRFSPQAFFQPNQKVAEKMFEKAISMLQLNGNEKVLDLYSGIGTIGILLAKHVRQVISVELNAHAVCDAKENIERLGIENIQVYRSDVARFFATHGDFFTPDIVVIDPPRSGLDQKTKKFLRHLQSKKIVYISCNPKTQASDFLELKDLYEIEMIAPFDQFPHTPHIENIILLTAKASI